MMPPQRAKDVADALGIQDGRKLTANLGDHQYAHFKKSNVANSDGSFPNRGMACAIDMGGEAWFPAKDVCALLGHTHPTKAVKDNCHSGDVQVVLRSNLTGGSFSDFPNRGKSCVKESGRRGLVRCR